MNQTNYETEVKALSEFIKICEKMLRQSADMPNKEKSILNRLERCKTKLNVILACATVTTIHQKAEKLSEQINELEEQIHISSGNVMNEIKMVSEELKETGKEEHQNTRDQINITVVDHNFQTNWKVRVVKDSNSIIVNSGREDKAFRVSNLQLDIILALVKYGLSEKQNQEFMYWEDLIPKIPKWKIQEDSSIDDDDIRRHIMNIRKIFGDSHAKIIETKRSYGYRISTNPANISVE